MIDKPLKEKIAKIYSATTKASIVFSVLSIVLSLVVKNFTNSDSRADYYLSYTAIILLVATPFTGVLIAAGYYISQKDKRMTAVTVLILVILVAGIFTKI